MNENKKYESKQVIVIRKDLNMRKGKMISQGAHASLKVILDNNHRLNDPPVKEWLEGTFTKICVFVNSEEELLDVYDKASVVSIPCSLIQDAGFTEFHGIPTYTCCAIGPWTSEEIDTITGNLKLL